MSQVPSGPAAAAPAASPALPQGPPPQGTASAAAPTGTGLEDEYVRVQRAQLADWNGDYHTALKQARDYNRMSKAGWDRVVKTMEENGLTGEDILRYWNTPEGQAAPAATGQPQIPPPPQGAQTLTAEQIDQIFAKRLAEYENTTRARSKEEQTQAEQAKVFQQGLDTEKTFRDKTLAELKLPEPKDGKPNRRLTRARAFFNSALNEVIEEDIPSHWPEKRRQEAMNTPATESQLQRARKTFLEDWADIRTETAASIAQGDADTPPASLGGGASGAPPQRTLDQMNHEEAVAALTHNLPSNKRRR